MRTCCHSACTPQAVRGIVNIADGSTGLHYQAISLVWLLYNSIPYFLVIQYAFGKPARRPLYCLACFGLSFALAAATLVVLWTLLPWPVNEARILRLALEFLEAQKAGEIGKLL